MRKCRPIAARFWAKVDKRGPDECWPWTGWTNKGYGRICAGMRGPYLYSHRVSYELNVGPIPEGLGVLHRCDNPPCCNPSHFFLGTRADNNADMVAKGRNRSLGSCGEDSGNARLSAETVLKIRAADGSHTQIAKQFGVSRSHIVAIRKRRRWAHLPEEHSI